MLDLTLTDSRNDDAALGALVAESAWTVLSTFRGTW
jgi:hypothetical protein